MSIRRRIALVSAAAVAVAVVLASALTYLLTSHQLSNQVDAQLRNRGRDVSLLVRALEEAGGKGGRTVRHLRERELRLEALGTLGTPAGGTSSKASRSTARSAPPRVLGSGLFGRLPPGPGQVRGYQQVIAATGRIIAVSNPGVSLPVDARTRALAQHGGSSFFSDTRVHGIHLRILAESLSGGRAVQFAQPLSEQDSLLGRLRLYLALIVIGGIALAALLGRLVAGTAVRPLKRLSEAAEHVGRTQDLSRRIEPSGGDELGRLASSFNDMLDTLERSMGALDASVHAQRQLVADASHELRTPVTSLRTNIEILQQQVGRMDEDEQRRMLDDVVEQIGELTALMNDLIDLARDEERPADTEEVRLDALVGEVIERARRNAPDTPVRAELRATVVSGVPARLERAVGNLIDNAVKYSPAGAPVEVLLRGGELTVRDHGPGVCAQDLPHIFDRFYRGADARGRPGSGLGLAIVRQVVDQHGGSVSVEQAPGGGTIMRMRLPDSSEIVEPAGAEPASEAPYSTV